jgi:alkylglycerol monooxygenase
LHSVFKPLAMLLAIVYVMERLRLRTAPNRFGVLLVAGLAFSLAGDCFLMFPGFFIPGLVSFLIAHLFYIALFKQGTGWFPSRRALVITLGFGAAMYAFLFNGLNPVLKAAVAAYVVVIALMAAQAIGRATVVRDRASIGVAVGAGFFMLSDALLATNKFAMPLPMAQFWVLATYYVAQILIACNAQAVIAGSTRNPSAYSVNSSPALFGGTTPR